MLSGVLYSYLVLNFFACSGIICDRDPCRWYTGLMTATGGVGGVGGGEFRVGDVGGVCSSALVSVFMRSIELRLMRPPCSSLSCCLFFLANSTKSLFHCGELDDQMVTSIFEKWFLLWYASVLTTFNPSNRTSYVGRLAHFSIFFAALAGESVRGCFSGTIVDYSLFFRKLGGVAELSFFLTNGHTQTECS